MTFSIICTEGGLGIGEIGEELDVEERRGSDTGTDDVMEELDWGCSRFVDICPADRNTL
jgi:hypothetical protein